MEIQVTNTARFVPKSFIYVGWGLDTEERAVLVDFGSMILLEPLKASHFAGEEVVQPDKTGGDAHSYMLMWEKGTYIQAVVRAWLERSKYLRLRNAAILMQAAERCLLCSSSYDKEKLALLRAQRLAKAWLARKQYGRAIAASVAMQAAGSSYLAKKMWHDEKQKQKIAYIQAVVRAWLERAKYLRLR